MHFPMSCVKTFKGDQEIRQAKQELIGNRPIRTEALKNSGSVILRVTSISMI